MAARTAVISGKDDAGLKPVDLANIIKVELELGRCDDILPKDIIDLANKKLGRETKKGASVKDEAVACRAAIRAMPTSYWIEGYNGITKGSPPQDLVDRILAKPPTAGGFAAAVACKVLSPKDIDTQSVKWGGAYSIDGMGLLRPTGAYCTTEVEMEHFAKLFKSAAPAHKLGDTTFLVEERTHPAPGQTSMAMKANKSCAKLVGLYTPKWCVLAIYHFVDAESEEKTLALLEEMRREAYPK